MKTFKEIYNESKILTGKMSGDTDRASERMSIMFRDKKTPSATWANSSMYTYDSHGDGWFRLPRGAGMGEGYGLIFKNLKVTSKQRMDWSGKPKHFDDGKVDFYKATFEYVPNEYTNDVDWDTKYEKTPIWFAVPEGVDVKDAIKTFQKDIKRWYP